MHEPVTRERFEALEAEVAYLRSELGLDLNEERIAFFCDRLNLMPTAGRMLDALYQAKGRPLSIQRLLDAMNSADETGKGVGVRVCHIRKVLGFEAIATRWSRGYSLTPAGMQRVNALLA